MWPALRKKTLICYYLWFSTALIYYGLTLNSNTLGTDLFLTFSIGKVIPVSHMSLRNHIKDELVSISMWFKSMWP